MSSYCDIESRQCTPLTTCPRRNAVGGYFCNTNANCNCATSSELKGTLELDGNTCHLCYDTADGESCDFNQECAPTSYCDVSTKLCDNGTNCPIIGPSATYTCITDPSCLCPAPKVVQVGIPRSDLSGSVCYVCVLPDNADCEAWYDCLPESRCGLDDICLPDSTCRFTEALSCSSDPNCTCPPGRFQQENDSTSGGKCYSCTRDSNFNLP